jgi:two-component system sensor histidine kinase UhpB
MTSLKATAWRSLLALLLLSSLGISPSLDQKPDGGDNKQPPARVAVDTGPLLLGTHWLVRFAGGVAVGMGILLYLIPARAVAVSRRRIEATLMERAVSYQEEDRRRIARELHDGAGQALTAARLQLMALREDIRDVDAVDRILKSLDEAIDEVRRSTSALAPPALAELGLLGALEQHCEAFALASQLRVSCEVPDRLPPLPASVELSCYRIAQEALHNTARHAGAKNAWVRLQAKGSELLLSIGDNGVGLLPQSSPGLGLDSIAERVRLA